MKTTFLLGLLLTLPCAPSCSSFDSSTDSGEAAPATGVNGIDELENPLGTAPRTNVINSTCPRSGKPVSSDSLTEYRGRIVGFCNTHCRDDFAANVADRPDDRAFFDTVLEKEGEF